MLVAFYLPTWLAQIEPALKDQRWLGFPPKTRRNAQIQICYRPHRAPRRPNHSNTKSPDAGRGLAVRVRQKPTPMDHRLLHRQRHPKKQSAVPQAKNLGQRCGGSRWDLYLAGKQSSVRWCFGRRRSGPRTDSHWHCDFLLPMRALAHAHLLTL